MKSGIIIVGGGISGLMTENTLRGFGKQVTILEKEANLGGRLATLHLSSGLADTGAQFFTVRSEAFANWVQLWQKEGLVYVWSRGWSDGSLRPSRDEGNPRYAVRGGMNELVQSLARDAETGGARILPSMTVSAVRAQEGGWKIETLSGGPFYSEALVLSTPVAISLSLLDAGATKLQDTDRMELESAAYAPSITAVFRILGDIMLPDPGVLQKPNGPISWIADNQRKGISPDARLITVQASPSYSLELWDAPPEEALSILQAEVHSLLSPQARVEEAHLVRWPYALPTQTIPSRCLLAKALPPLVFAGDAFAGPRVEGAALSGIAAGRSLAALIEEQG